MRRASRTCHRKAAAPDRTGGDAERTGGAIDVLHVLKGATQEQMLMTDGITIHFPNGTMWGGKNIAVRASAL